MKSVPSGIDGLIELIPSVYPDNRGWFFESFKESTIKDLGVPSSFVQDNISFSKKGVIRGMHMQLPPHDQAKLVLVVKGRVLDVAVDLRPKSPTFGKVAYFTVDSEKHNMVYIPEGFAHGFAALEDSYFFYKMSKLYNRDAECGIIWNDPDLDIQWPFNEVLISEKDLKLPTLSELLGKSVISRF